MMELLHTSLRRYVERVRMSVCHPPCRCSGAFMERIGSVYTNRYVERGLGGSGGSGPLNIPQQRLAIWRTTLLHSKSVRCKRTCVGLLTCRPIKVEGAG